MATGAPPGRTRPREAVPAGASGARSSGVLPLRPLRRSLAIGLLRARESVMQQFRPLLNEHGLTEQQWRVLRVLAEGPSPGAAELARDSCILPASLTRILRDLVRVGLLRTSAAAADSRRLTISLTAEGRALYERVAVRSEAIYQRIERRVGKAELAELGQALRRLESLLAAGAPPASAPKTVRRGAARRKPG